MALISSVGSNLSSSLSTLGEQTSERRTQLQQPAAQDRVEISSAAKSLGSGAGIVQVLQSATGRTPASVPNMATWSPSSATGAGAAASDFKGTTALLDSLSNFITRSLDIDVTVGGPNAANSLAGSALLQPPKLPQKPMERAEQKPAEVVVAKDDTFGKPEEAKPEDKILQAEEENREETTGKLEPERFARSPGDQELRKPAIAELKKFDPALSGTALNLTA
jgi:hypothetical protein